LGQNRHFELSTVGGVRFYCDRCNAQVDEPDDLVEPGRSRRLERALGDVSKLLRQRP
jgi:hypothetical protein